VQVTLLRRKRDKKIAGATGWTEQTAWSPHLRTARVRGDLNRMALKQKGKRGFADFSPRGGVKRPPDLMNSELLKVYGSGRMFRVNVYKKILGGEEVKARLLRLK